MASAEDILEWTRSRSEDGATAERGEFSVRLKTLQGDTFTVVLPNKTPTVDELKQAIETQKGHVIARQRLLFGGKVLKDGKPLSAFGVKDGSTLNLVLRKEGVEPPSAEERQRIAAEDAAAASRQPTQGSLANVVAFRVDADLQQSSISDMISSVLSSIPGTGASAAAPHSIPVVDLRNELNPESEAEGSPLMEGRIGRSGAFQPVSELPPILRSCRAIRRQLDRTHVALAKDCEHARGHECDCDAHAHDHVHGHSDTSVMSSAATVPTTTDGVAMDSSTVIESGPLPVSESTATMAVPHSASAEDLLSAALSTVVHSGDVDPAADHSLATVTGVDVDMHVRVDVIGLNPDGSHLSDASIVAADGHVTAEDSAIATGIGMDVSSAIATQALPELNTPLIADSSESAVGSVAAVSSQPLPATVSASSGPRIRRRRPMRKEYLSELLDVYHEAMAQWEGFVQPKDGECDCGHCGEEPKEKDKDKEKEAKKCTEERPHFHGIVEGCDELINDLQQLWDETAPAEHRYAHRHEPASDGGHSAAECIMEVEETGDGSEEKKDAEKEEVVEEVVAEHSVAAEDLEEEDSDVEVTATSDGTQMAEATTAVGTGVDSQQLTQDLERRAQFEGERLVEFGTVLASIGHLLKLLELSKRSGDGRIELSRDWEQRMIRMRVPFAGLSVSSFTLDNLIPAATTQPLAAATTTESVAVPSSGSTLPTASSAAADSRVATGSAPQPAAAAASPTSLLSSLLGAMTQQPSAGDSSRVAPTVASERSQVPAAAAPTVANGTAVSSAPPVATGTTAAAPTPVSTATATATNPMSNLMSTVMRSLGGGTAAGGGLASLLQSFTGGATQRRAAAAGPSAATAAPLNPKMADQLMALTFRFLVATVSVEMLQSARECDYSFLESSVLRKRLRRFVFENCMHKSDSAFSRRSLADYFALGFANLCVGPFATEKRAVIQKVTFAHMRLHTPLFVDLLLDSGKSNAEFASDLSDWFAEVLSELVYKWSLNYTDRTRAVVLALVPLARNTLAAAGMDASKRMLIPEFIGHFVEKAKRYHLAKLAAATSTQKTATASSSADASELQSAVSLRANESWALSVPASDRGRWVERLRRDSARVPDTVTSYASHRLSQLYTPRGTDRQSLESSTAAASKRKRSED